MNLIVLSLPCSGTHFVMKFLVDVLEQEAKFEHFELRSEAKIKAALQNEEDLVIVPERNPASVIHTWRSKGQPENKLFSMGDLKYCLLKDAKSKIIRVQVDDPEEGGKALMKIASLLGKQNSDRTKEFIRAWPVISSQHSTPEQKQEHDLILKGKLL